MFTFCCTNEIRLNRKQVLEHHRGFCTTVKWEILTVLKFGGWGSKHSVFLFGEVKFWRSFPCTIHWRSSSKLSNRQIKTIGKFFHSRVVTCQKHALIVIFNQYDCLNCITDVSWCSHEHYENWTIFLQQVSSSWRNVVQYNYVYLCSMGLASLRLVQVVLLECTQHTS